MEGRAPGSFVRQSRTTSASSSETPVRSGSSWAIRNISAWAPPLSAVPNGNRPDAAYARTAPRQNTSHAVVTRSPRTCSGAMKPGEPTRTPVRVSSPSCTDSRARAMPKSMTRGPSMVIRTFEGFRSRWTSPAPWMCWRAWASPDPRNRTERDGSGPYAPEAVTGAPGRPETTRLSEGPATYPVATQGTGASVSASRTGAVHAPPTRCAARTSWRKRARNSWRAASSPWTSLRATVRPRSERARKTRPMPPSPRRPRSRYAPMRCGSSGPSLSMVRFLPCGPHEDSPAGLGRRGHGPSLRHTSPRSGSAALPGPPLRARPGNAFPSGPPWPPLRA